MATRSLLFERLKMTEVQAGWYKDPDGNPCERFWDGQKWTLNTRPISPTSVTSHSSNSQSEMSTGWKIALGISFALAILLVIYSASVPDFWTT
jgi:hypothetical protein